MIIAGAGGHALEVMDELRLGGLNVQDISFYDEFGPVSNRFGEEFAIYSDEKVMNEIFKLSPSFILGIGRPNLRAKFFSKLSELGGKYYPLHSIYAKISPSALGDFDVFTNCFVGPHTQIGVGTLINTGAQVHHECQVGQFCEIGPGAILLGNVRIGDFCIIGAGAIILPGIHLGNNVIVGAGAVVTKDFHENGVLKGIPAIANKK
jgi:sugar O-acyltransferase (sialic acid O-acetyltransferase NeuD family)